MADSAHDLAPDRAENMETKIPKDLRCEGTCPEEQFLAIMALMSDLDHVDDQLKTHVAKRLAPRTWPDLDFVNCSTRRRCINALRKNECPDSDDTLLLIMISRINTNSLVIFPSGLEEKYAAAGYDMLESLSEEMLPGSMTLAANKSGPASTASGATRGPKRPGSALSDPRPKKTRVAVNKTLEDNQERDRRIDGLENHVTNITKLLRDQHEESMRRIQCMEESGNTLKDINQRIADLKPPQRLQTVGEQVRVYRKLETMEQELETMKKEREEEKKEREKEKKEREEEKKELEAEKMAIKTRKKALDAVKNELDAKKERLLAEDQERYARDKGLNARDKELDAREEGLDAREKGYFARAKGYRARVKELDAREEGLNAKSAEEKR